MKKIFTFLLFSLSISAGAQVMVVDGCSSISGGYTQNGVDATGRNMFSASHACTGCGPQTLLFNASANRWELRMMITFTYDNALFAYNTNPTSPNPPETGWIINMGTICNAATMRVHPPDTKVATCSSCNWSDPNTWTPTGVPGANANNVTIDGDVILDVDANIVDLKINSGKSLVSAVDRTLKVNGLYQNDGNLTVSDLTLKGTQTLNGTKLNTKRLTAGRVILTGNLSAFYPAAPSDPSHWVKGSFELGNYDLTTSYASTPNITTNGTGKLKRYFPAGNIDADLPGLYFSFGKYPFPVRITGAANTGTNRPVLVSIKLNPAFSHRIPSPGYVKAEWDVSVDYQSLETPFTMVLRWYPPSSYPDSDSETEELDKGSLFVKRWNGSDWENKTNGQDASETSEVTVTNISQFSHWGIFSTDAVLPVKLVDFVVANQDETRANRVALLRWTTSEENNSQKFEVQHSQTGKTWKRIGDVLASGDSDQNHNYTYTHDQPETGVNFYRLKMIDKDGSFAYSRIRDFVVNDYSLSYVYPNPVANRLYIEKDDAKKIKQALIFDTSGKLVDKFDANLNSGISVKNLPAGPYILKIIREDDSIVTQKFLIGR
ncbi:T9SS type A sorting domain-containing protein [Dyadobacter sp. CY261]|uniref:T9SS type A sorting domain-containing protein n=1 Tax=Dyadobacter sp. CY261 TaxID=2907203 RepID=UPI001F226233|nr:T9SS type A sorting domain-containing protein [Dyadobacter sp. CY261]MCF0075579.1 T9SS type A sorting domain-containing protein [Dyadobacter sp. CY261]